MTWAIAASAAIAVGTSYVSSQSQASSAIRSANTASKAQGEAITKERLNASIRNSYATSIAQMQLGLQKRQLAQQGADISAASLAAEGNADLAAAATGSIGASTNAVVSDIQSKMGRAQDMTNDQFENAMENYNNELALMVINVDETAPSVSKIQSNIPSSGAMFGSSLMAGLGSFASNYAMRNMSLGLGSSPTLPQQSVNTLSTPMSFGAP